MQVLANLSGLPCALQRLETWEQFQTVMAGGIVCRSPHFVLHRAFMPGAQVWVGALVPKRWARRAVTRNAIKRQVYAMTEQYMPYLLRAQTESKAPETAGALAGNLAYVVRLRTAFDRKVYPSASSLALKSAVRQELAQLWASHIGLAAPAQA